MNVHSIKLSRVFSIFCGLAIIIIVVIIALGYQSRCISTEMVMRASTAKAEDYTSELQDYYDDLNNEYSQENYVLKILDFTYKMSNKQFDNLVTLLSAFQNDSKYKDFDIYSENKNVKSISFYCEDSDIESVLRCIGNIDYKKKALNYSCDSIKEDYNELSNDIFVLENQRMMMSGLIDLTDNNTFYEEAVENIDSKLSEFYSQKEELDDMMDSTLFIITVFVA